MTAPVPAGAPDVPDDVIERLAGLMAHTPAQVAPTQAHMARILVAHLRAHPEDAAAALGGEVSEEWGVRYDLAPMTAPPGRQAGEVAAFPDEHEARTYAWHMAPPWQCQVVHRVVHTSAWREVQP